MYMKKFISLLLITCAIITQAQVRYSPSAQQLLLNHNAGIQHAKDNGKEHYIHTTLQVSDIDALEQYGIIVGSQVGDFTTALVPASMFARLGEIAAISYVDAGNISHLLLDKALSDIEYDKILTLPYTPQPYLGKGVIVGIVDLGFQWDHAAFRNADGSTRIIAAWNQNDTTGTSPHPYSYGSLYDSEEEILNGYCGVDEVHATHVTGIAAGSAIADIPYGGVAREASLILVEAQHAGGSGMFDQGITDGINFIFNYADSLDMPCVINLSIGSNFGPHDGTSIFDQMCDSLQGPGRLIVGAMGNSGRQHYHLGYDFDSEHTEFRAGMRQEGNALPELDAWCDEPFSIELELYHGHTDTILDTTGWIPLDSVFETTLKYFYREMTVTATSQLCPFNNKYNIHVVVSGIKNLGNAYFALKARGEKGHLDIWNNAPGTQFSSRGFEGWLEGDTKMTLNEIGGTGKRITSVGAYTSDTLKYCIDGSSYSVDYQLHAVAPFSSRGHTADGRIKPEIIAPGCIITSAYNKFSAAQPFNFYREMTTNIYYLHNDSNYYGANSGTSMAAPVVTGTYAIWLQAKPDLTPEEAKEVLRLTATQDPYTTQDDMAGYGKINPYKGLLHLLDKAKVESPFEGNNVGIFPTIGDGNFTLLCNPTEQPRELRIYNSTGMLIGIYNIDEYIENTPLQFYIPNNSRGIYYIQVTTDKGQYTYKYITH